MTIGINAMRLEVSLQYAHAKWEKRVAEMSEAQVTAIWYRMQESGILKEKAVARRATRLAEAQPQGFTQLDINI